MKRGLKDRALSLLLVLSLLLGLAPAVYASGGGERTVTFEEASPDSVTANLTLEERQVEESPKQEPDENDMVRVSVVLERPLCWIRATPPWAWPPTKALRPTGRA